MQRVHFDPEKHVYRLGGSGGRILPSVTGIIRPLMDFSMVDPTKLEYRRQLGTAVHLATELHDEGNLNEDTLDPAIIPYLDAWKKFKLEMNVNILASEESIFHSTLLYAGRLDNRATVGGWPYVIDKKCTATLSPVTGIQLAGYLGAVGAKNTRRAAVQLKENGSYVFEEYVGAGDWPMFISLLNVKNWREKHGIK